MTDQHGGLLDAAQQALRLERIEGEHRLLASQMKNSVDTLTSTLHALQADTRSLVAKIGDLASLQHAHDTSRDAIADVRKSVADLNAQLSKWFTDFETRSTNRWDRFERENTDWRMRHEAENEDAQRTMGQELRTVRETTIRFAAFGAAVVLLGGTIVGGFIWTLNYRFGDAAADLSRVENVSAKNRQLLDRMGEAHGAELADIKLYLARGGRIPAEPYVPQSQRKDDEQPKPRK